MYLTSSRDSISKPAGRDLFVPLRSESRRGPILNPQSAIRNRVTARRSLALPSKIDRHDLPFLSGGFCRDSATDGEPERACVREALSALEMLGLIECRSGQGNYIKADGSNGTIDGEMLKTLLQDHDAYEIFEARLEMEPNMAALAAGARHRRRARKTQGLRRPPCTTSGKQSSGMVLRTLWWISTWKRTDNSTWRSGAPRTTTFCLPYSPVSIS